MLSARTEEFSPTVEKVRDGRYRNPYEYWETDEFKSNEKLLTTRLEELRKAGTKTEQNLEMHEERYKATRAERGLGGKLKSLKAGAGLNAARARHEKANKSVASASKRIDDLRAAPFHAINDAWATDPAFALH